MLAQEILKNINEWKRGCSNATSEHPELCQECTRGLIDAIEQKAIKDNSLDKAVGVMSYFIGLAISYFIIVHVLVPIMGLG